jgi:hypothetical protein
MALVHFICAGAINDRKEIEQNNLGLALLNAIDIWIIQQKIRDCQFPP